MSDIAITTKNASNMTTTITTETKPDKPNDLDYISIHPGMGRKSGVTIEATDIDQELRKVTSIRLDTSRLGTNMPTPIFTVSPNTGDPQEVPIALQEKVEATAVIAPESYPGGYRHFANEIGETATLKWFTKDERELLISLYNRVNAGLKVELPPQIRVLTWVVQPSTRSGIQKVLLTTPFQGFVRACIVSCDGWATDAMSVVVKSTDPTPGAVQEDVVTIGLPTLASATGKYVSAVIPGDKLFYKGSQFDIELPCIYSTLPNYEPITVELVLEAHAETKPTFI